MQATIVYQDYLRSLVIYTRNGKIWQSVSYSIRRSVAQVLNICYFN